MTVRLLVVLPILASILVPISSITAQSGASGVTLLWSHVRYDYHGCPSSNDCFFWWQFLGAHVDRDANVYTLSAIMECCSNDGLAHLTKYGPDGTLEWVYSNVPTHASVIHGGIATDLSGNVYVTEEHSYAWDSITPTILNNGTQTVSVTKDGVFRWRDVYGGPEVDGHFVGPAAIAVINERAYVTSWRLSEQKLLTYDLQVGSPTISPVYSGYVLGEGPFIIEPERRGNVYLFGKNVHKHDPNGVELALSPSLGKILSTSTDSTGSIYCLSTPDGNKDQVILTKLDTNLAVIWQKTYPQSGAQPGVVMSNPDGAVTVMSTGGVRWYQMAARYAPDGSVIWMQDWVKDDWNPADAVRDRLGNFYVIDTGGVIGSYDADANLRWQTDIGGPFLTVLSPSQQYYLPYYKLLHIDRYGDIVYTVLMYWYDPDNPQTRRSELHVGKLTQAKTFMIRDALGDSIPNTSFHLIRVSNDPPQYTEDTLGIFTTDDRGLFVFPIAGDDCYEFEQSADNPESDLIYVGDTLKIARLVDTEPAVRHAGVLGSMRSIHLDNADFLPDGTLVFDTLELGSIQEIRLNHTEYRYNLLASIEWDAEESYVQGLTADFKQMSNYLYDVSDGQIRLDTVVILDDRSMWNEADIQISASNIYWPDAGIAGVTVPWFPPIKMPRKWFGLPDTCRAFSYLLHPLVNEVSDNYRTLAHELGHYGLAFSDEYVFVDGTGHRLPDAARCGSLPGNIYGFMDRHYDRPYFGALASEMSSEYRYLDGSCRNTAQWYDNSRSCWDDFEHWAEGVRNGIYVPIQRPSVTDSTERKTPAGLNYFAGPNDDLYDLDYDVGRLVRFPSAVVAPAPGIQSVHLRIDYATPGGLNVQLLRRGASPIYQIDQGSTNDQGRLWVYGMDFFQDEILASASGWTTSLANGFASSSAGAQKTWLCGSVQPGSGVSRTRSQHAVSAPGDSLELSLRPIAGDYPMVCEGQFSDNGGWTYGLWFERAMSQAPQLDIVTDRGDFTMGIFSAGTDSYGCEIASYLTASGKATVWAVDDSSNTFFFSSFFEVLEVTSPGQLQKMIGPGGDAVFRVDSSNSGIQRTMILSSAYPPLMTGLESGAVQAGQTHSLSTYPDNAFVGSSSISLSYSDSDLRDQYGTVLGDEATLRIFRWNSGPLQWESVGGYVDTTLNIVTASIDQPGVYGAFTTAGGCCLGRVGDANNVGEYPDEVTLGDVMMMVDAKFISTSCDRITCIAEADINQDGGAQPRCDDITLGDIMILIDFLFIHPDNAVLPECL